MGRNLLPALFSVTAIALLAGPVLAADALGGFVGTWTSENKQYVLKLGADGNAVMTGDFGPISTERGKWTECKAEGNKLLCNWVSTYADEMKDITRHGVVEATMEGNALKGTMKVEKVDVEQWHGAPEYPSRAEKDLPFSFVKG